MTEQQPISVKDLSELAKRQHRGELSQKEMAETLHRISHSISFPSILEYSERVYGTPLPKWSSGRVPFEQIDATQTCLDFTKLHLVRWLFVIPGTFDKLNRMYFPNHPISVLRLGNGRYAVLDGHHRIWQGIFLMGKDASVLCRVVTTRNPDMVTAIRRQVETVRQVSGDAHLWTLPVRDVPSQQALVSLGVPIEQAAEILAHSAEMRTATDR